MSGSGVDESGEWSPAFEGQRPPFEPGNELSVRHGASSERRIAPVARAHRRRVLRQLRLRASDLDPLARGYLDLYARTLAKVELLDAYFAEHGLLTASGEPQGGARFYVSLVNSARLALSRLEAHLASRDPAVAGIEALIVEGRAIRERHDGNGAGG